MKCTKCGKKVKKDVKMCPYCGNDSFEETNNKFVETIKGKKKIILGVGIPVIVLFIAFLVTWNVYLKYDKINVNEYLEVNLDTDTQGNYDGAGEYIIFFDSEKLSREVVRSASKKIKKSVASEIIDDIIDVKEPKKNGSFKNGDICKVTIKYTNKKLKEYNIMLTGGTVKKRVKNLKKTTKLDPFEGAAMVTKGAAPNVKITIDNIQRR